MGTDHAAFVDRFLHRRDDELNPELCDAPVAEFHHLLELAGGELAHHQIFEDRRVEILVAALPIEGAEQIGDRGAVLVDSLSAAEATFLDALASGMPLAPAAETALQEDAGFEFGASLQQWIATGLLHKARLETTTE